MSHDMNNDGKARDHEYRENRTTPPSSPFTPESDCTAKESTESYIMYPNTWVRWRNVIREPAAEFFGTMVLILFGDGVACQVVLGGNPAVSAGSKGEYLSISCGWGTAIALAVWISGGISGGHVNPAVTLASAVFRGFPWKKVPSYIFAQLMGAFCGAAILYANYFHAIDIYEGGKGVRTVPGTASLFATYPLDYMTPVSAFFDEFIGAALLVMVVFAVNDKKNLAPQSGMLPLALFFAVFGIAMSFGMQTGFAINPARDLGPRLLTAMVGYGKDVFTFRNQYWIWCPILGPVAGALVGAFLYDTFLFAGVDNISNTTEVDAKAHQEKVPGKIAGDIV